MAWEYAFHYCALISSLDALLPGETSQAAAQAVIMAMAPSVNVFAIPTHTITISKAACVHGFECTDA